jgi:hypothetical protein
MKNKFYELNKRIDSAFSEISDIRSEIAGTRKKIMDW